MIFDFRSYTTNGVMIFIFLQCLKPSISAVDNEAKPQWRVSLPIFFRPLKIRLTPKTLDDLSFFKENSTWVDKM